MCVPSNIAQESNNGIITPARNTIKDLHRKQVSPPARNTVKDLHRKQVTRHSTSHEPNDKWEKQSYRN